MRTQNIRANSVNALSPRELNTIEDVLHLNISNANEIENCLFIANQIFSVLTGAATLESAGETKAEGPTGLLGRKINNAQHMGYKTNELYNLLADILARIQTPVTEAGGFAGNGNPGRIG